ncbi:MAG: Gfo/Idh/MocA family oxidoreductase [Bacillota bacterium]|jgi:predicted dehydrogenase
MSEEKGCRNSFAVLHYGMVGGGPGSFVGDVHRKAVNFDGQAILTAGCFSQSYAKTLKTGEVLKLDPARLYRDFAEMARKEAARADPIDFVVIVTPNYAHYEIVKAFLENGIHVVCDKPLAVTVAEAEELAGVARDHDLLFCVSYVYSGYAMVKQAREMVGRGDLGEIQMVMAEYPGDWLSQAIAKDGAESIWRTDPKYAGVSNCVADIGSHIENTVSYLTGLRLKSLCAKLDAFGANQVLDTNAMILVSYTNGASGVYWCSEVAIGHDNDLKVRIFGTKGSLEWCQGSPDRLKVAFLGQPVRIFSKGADYLYPSAIKRARVPAGHPEGYYEAFANIYQVFIHALQKKKAGEKLKEEDLDFPNVEAGINGVKFINRCVESSRQGSVWVSW